MSDKFITVADLVNVLMTLNQETRLSFSDGDSRIFMKTMGNTWLFVDPYDKSLVFGSIDISNEVGTEPTESGLINIGEWLRRQEVDDAKHD